MRESAATIAYDVQGSLNATDLYMFVIFFVFLAQNIAMTNLIVVALGHSSSEQHDSHRDAASLLLVRSQHREHGLLVGRAILLTVLEWT